MSSTKSADMFANLSAQIGWSWNHNAATPSDSQSEHLIKKKIVQKSDKNQF